MNFLQTLGTSFITGLYVIGSLLGIVSTPTPQVVQQSTQPPPLVVHVEPPTQPTVTYEQTPTFAAAIAQSPALVDTYLVSGIERADTTMTLADGTTRDGQTLSGYYCFTIDAGTPLVEYACGTASGATVSSLERGIMVSNPTATSSTLAFRHRAFATVQVTDFPTIQLLARRANGVDPFESLLYYSNDVSTSSISATSSGQVIPNRDYVDFVGTSGCSNALEGTRGCSELATNEEVASSTPTGGSGARLVIPASVATSTPDTAHNGAVVVSTEHDRKINQDFIDLTEDYTWSGNQTFASTTIDANDANPLTLNGRPYKLPTTEVASSSLMTDGEGNLSWLFPQSRTLYVNGTASTSNGHVGTTTAFTISIPANTLGTNSIVRITTKTSGTGSGGRGPQIDIQLGDGSASTTIAYHNVPDVAWSVTSTIFSTTASAQETFSSSDAASATFAGLNVTSTLNPSYKVATSLDSTAENYLSFRLNPTNASNVSTIKGILIEVLNS